MEWGLSLCFGFDIMAGLLKRLERGCTGPAKRVEGWQVESFRLVAREQEKDDG